MSHQIDLKNHSIRTDLAIEAVKNTNDLKGIISKEERVEGLMVTSVTLDEEGGKRINKKAGNYITIEFYDVTDTENRKKVTKVFKGQLEKMLLESNLSLSSSCLVIGLGNQKSTPDALGPMSLDQVMVTNPLYLLGELGEGFRRVWAIKPGVMGETGVETSDFIVSLVDKIKPDFVLTIDALASQSIERVGKTIQMTDTGIHPGSGVGNSRKEISRHTLAIPVIAVGVPTVVDAVTIVSDTMHYLYKHFAYTKENINNPMNKLIIRGGVNYLKKDIVENPQDKEQLLGLVGSLKEGEVKQLIEEVLTPIGYNLMVTPKEVDFLMDQLSEVLSSGINGALHPKLEEIA